ncbi:unnamed protein product [Brassica oleracea var. botrytis]
MKKDGSPDKPPTEQTHEEGSTRNSHHGSQSKHLPLSKTTKRE